MKKSILSYVLLATSTVVLAGCSLTSEPITAPSSIAPVSSPTTEMNTSQEYMMSDVASHNSASDCWLVVDGSVYDVTSFISEHPGGNDILKGCGKDATKMVQGEREHKENMTNVEAALTSLKIGTLKK
jgi:cytochrome b involved in lipid metabolism